MPFGQNGWPMITESDVHCRKEREHRLYRAIGQQCPCGPIPFQVIQEDMSINIYGDDIIFCTKDKEAFKISDLFRRIEQLEQEVESLRKTSSAGR